MGGIPEEIISQIVERNDIVEVISSYFPLKRAGRNFKATCPFHNEKTPSFVVNPDKQIFHCFGCGVGGDVISFVMKQERIEFLDAVRTLAQKVNIVIPDSNNHSAADNIRHLVFKVNELAADYFHANLLKDNDPSIKKIKEYLSKRAINDDSIKTFRLGYAINKWDGLINYLKNKNISLKLMEQAGLIIARENGEGYYDRFRDRVIFPIFDTRGNIRAFGARALGESSAKYINSPESVIYTKGHHLYGFNLAKSEILAKDYVIIVEGYVDFIIPFQHGVKNIVASLGTALTVEQIRFLHRYTKNVVMLFDSDQAGLMAMIRSFDTLIEEGMNVKVVTLAEGQDPDSYVREFGVDAFKERIDSAQSLFDFKLKILLDKFDSKSIDGKAKIVIEMLPTINKFQDAVKKSEYIRVLAQKLAISEQALISELKKVGQTSLSQLSQKIKLHDTFKDDSTQKEEKNILKLLLEEEGFISKCKEDVESSYFKDFRIRHAIEKIYELFEQGKKINSSTLINNLTDDQTRQMVSGLITDDSMPLTNKERIYQDCIISLKEKAIKIKRMELREKIHEAEILKDNRRRDLLAAEFNKLVKK